MEIGLRIKELRLKNQLTQEELADRCELTKGFISQLENDYTSPSIATLKDILISLGSSLSEFFAVDEEEKLVFDESDHFVKEADGTVIKWLVPTSQKNAMEPITVTIDVGAVTQKDLPHEGEEFGYVLEGKLKLIHGKAEYIIRSGQSFYFRASKAHYLKNIGKTKASVIWVSCPPNF